MFEVPQGSILGPLFLIMENIGSASCADDNTPYTTGNSIEEVINKLEKAAKMLFVVQIVKSVSLLKTKK